MMKIEMMPFEYYEAQNENSRRKTYVFSLVYRLEKEYKYSVSIIPE